MYTHRAFSCLLVMLSLATASPLRAAGTGGGGNGAQSSGFPSETARSYDPAVEYAKGIEALRTGDYRAASRSFDRVLGVAPRDANANFMAGLARAGMRKFKEAGRYYAKAVKYDDSLVMAHRELGVTWIRLGEQDRAQTVLADLRSRAASCGEDCSQAGDLKTAISAIEAALAMPGSGHVPTDAEPPPTAQIGDRAYLDAVALINERRYHGAVKALKAALLAFGPHPDVLTYIGFAYRKQKRYDMAEAYYRQALAVAPHHVGATEYYGELMVERGDLVGAARMLSTLEDMCRFDCAEAEELRRWIVAAKPAS